MQFCRKVLCQPCSARVTSPEEDMEYRMGSCIGISHKQVNREEDTVEWKLFIQGEVECIFKMDRGFKAAGKCSSESRS